jgi:hypothetical protein
MTVRTITLGKEVMVSDPCYTESTWCQIKLDNVKPGNYIAYHKTHDAGDWGVRSSMILVIHQDHNDDEDLVWDLEDGEVVAMAVDFAVEEEPVIDFEFFK